MDGSLYVEDSLNDIKVCSLYCKHFGPDNMEVIIYLL